MKTSKSLLKIYKIAALAFLFISSQDAGAAITLSGDVTAKNQTGTHEGEVYRNYLKADVNLNETFENTEFKVILRAEDDTMRPDDNAAYLRDDTGSGRIYLREAFISHDFYFESVIDSINIKMGRIIYTWGNSDEVKPVDIINPQDYSNLYFTPIQDRKYGVFSGTVSVFFNENFFIEAVAVPEFNPSEMASSVFVLNELETLRATEYISGGDGIIEQNLPGKKIRNSSAAGRIGLTLFDIDMHASYYNGYDNLPVYNMNLTHDYRAVYKKVQMFGFDFQRALFSGISIRGEAAFFERGKYFAYDSAHIMADVSTGGTGSVEKKYTEYTIGFDDQDFIFDDLYLNLQFHQKIISSYESGLSSDQYTNMILWNVKYYLDNKKYRLSSQGACDIGEKSVYANAEFMAKLADNFEFTVGSWILEGDADTSIGQFDSNDMVYVSGKLTF
ncbi:MAG TPA: hypothetical protein PK514_07175 [Spirochaetota bacterium]|nr:hypothetical protein [Spirochaetota bacterium]